MNAPVLLPGAAGSFDETAVKDPSIVRSGGRWHLFYTARGRGSICNRSTAYLFFTRAHKDVMVMTAPLAEFPRGFRATGSGI